ncbi:MAG: DUF2188 domain-containing protein [Syntrophothermus sp.]
MSRNQHVMPYKDGWAVKGDESAEFTSVHKTLSEAIDAARRIAKKERAEIVIHKRNKVKEI